jgi:penicillin-binding protein 1A
VEPPQFDLKNIAPRIIPAPNAWLMADMLGDVIRRGTGVRALVLGRRDIGGKTGTTNLGQDTPDTWFNGFNRSVVASVWVGFDDLSPMGEGEEGSRTAVPIWVYYMREALRGTPDVARPRPDGLMDLRIVPRTGLLALDGDATAITETFIAEHLPTQATSIEGPQSSTGATSNESLF